MIRNILKNFNLFVDGRGFAGELGDYTPANPSIAAEEYRAGGMNGPIDIDMGQEKMTTSFVLRNYSADVLALWGVAPGRLIQVTARGALESEDGTVTPAIHNMRGKILVGDQDPVAPEPERKPPPMLTVPRRRGQRMFAAAETDRMTSGWTNAPMPADQIIRRNWRVLVARSREQSANNDYAKAFKASARRNLIGQKGLVLQAQASDLGGTLDAGANKAIETAWRAWCQAMNCDVKGRRTFRQIQKTIVNGLCTDGEFMVRMVYGADAGPWGFALQVLDPVLCPVDFDEDRRPGGGFIRAGIEYTKMGRPVAYYFTTLDQSQADYHYSGRAFLRVPADEIIHWFEEDFVGQKRGLPWMATALLRMRQLGEFEKSALNNAREGANKVGVIEWDEGMGPDIDDEEIQNEDGSLVDIELESESGVYHQLPAGARLKRVETGCIAFRFARRGCCSMRIGATPSRRARTCAIAARSSRSGGSNGSRAASTPEKTTVPGICSQQRATGALNS